MKNCTKNFNLYSSLIFATLVSINSISCATLKNQDSHQYGDLEYELQSLEKEICRDIKENYHDYYKRGTTEVYAVLSPALDILIAGCGFHDNEAIELFFTQTVGMNNERALIDSDLDSYVDYVVNLKYLGGMGLINKCVRPISSFEKDEEEQIDLDFTNLIFVYSETKGL
jgi:hypothetical protein